jgi:SAM-dependent methyltransferase
VPVVNAAVVFRCPICGGDSGRWAAEHNGLSIARCADCGHGYIWPVPDPEFLEGIYSRDDYYEGSRGSVGFSDYRSEEPARRRMFERHLDRLAALGAMSGRVLDVGCATGDFLKVARVRGWEVLGVDPSSARRDVEEAGIELVGTTVHDARVQPESLDLVTFWDVLEHVADPVGDLAAAARLLRPGGMLALSVPDSDNLVARISGRRWFGYKTAGEHLQFFTPDSLGRAFARAGLRLAVRRPAGWSCTLSFLSDRAGLYLGAPGRVARWICDRPRLSGIVLDVPQINQLAIGFEASR